MYSTEWNLDQKLDLYSLPKPQFQFLVALARNHEEDFGVHEMLLQGKYMDNVLTRK